jgi:hypothetical protein
MTGFFLFGIEISTVLCWRLKLFPPYCRNGTPVVGDTSRAQELITRSFQKIFSRGTRHALEQTGKHGRPNVKVGSDPAAITSLSAACRCASHPPSNPSVLPPEIRTQPAMAGFSRI